jgi:hypothetical protein
MAPTGRGRFMVAKTTKHEARLHRQIDALATAAPRLRRPLDTLRDHRFRLVRVPIALLLMGGSVLAILPIFGLWMLPLGAALLAIDVPALQPAVSRSSVRLRQWLRRRRAPGTSRSR